MSKLILKSKETKTNLKLKTLEKLIPKSLVDFNQNSQARVIEKNNTPEYFIFNTNAFLDILSTIDEKLEEKLDPKDYFNKNINPSWWLIGQIEERIPINKEELKTQIKEAKNNIRNKEIYSIKEISKELNLI